jgi:hypothetical protein
MKAEAIAVGEKVVASEVALDRAFRDRWITRAGLEALTAQIGEAQGQLRSVHLQYHLLTAELLTMHQMHQYAKLRGY